MSSELKHYLQGLIILHIYSAGSCWRNKDNNGQLCQSQLPSILQGIRAPNEDKYFMLYPLSLLNGNINLV